MANNKLSDDILKNPHYLNLKDSSSIKEKKSTPLVPIFLLIILATIPILILYSVSVGFIIGGFNFVFTNLFSIKTIGIKVFLYNLIIGFIGLGLMISTIYLTIFLIQLMKK